MEIDVRIVGYPLTAILTTIFAPRGPATSAPLGTDQLTPLSRKLFPRALLTLSVTVAFCAPSVLRVSTPAFAAEEAMMSDAGMIGTPAESVVNVVVCEEDLDQIHPCVRVTFTVAGSTTGDRDSDVGVDEAVGRGGDSGGCRTECARG